MGFGEMFDELLDDDPDLKKREERIAIQTLQTIVVEIVKGRFPSLVELAEQRIEQIDSQDFLRYLARLIATSPNEDIARWLLTS